MDGPPWIGMEGSVRLRNDPQLRNLVAVRSVLGSHVVVAGQEGLDFLDSLLTLIGPPE